MVLACLFFHAREEEWSPMRFFVHGCCCSIPTCDVAATATWLSWTVNKKLVVGMAMFSAISSFGTCIASGVLFAAIDAR